MGLQRSAGALACNSARGQVVMSHVSKGKSDLASLRICKEARQVAAVLRAEAKAFRKAEALRGCMNEDDDAISQFSGASQKQEESATHGFKEPLAMTKLLPASGSGSFDDWVKLGLSGAGNRAGGPHTPTPRIRPPRGPKPGNVSDGAPPNSSRREPSKVGQDSRPVSQQRSVKDYCKVAQPVSSRPTPSRKPEATTSAHEAAAEGAKLRTAESAGVPKEAGTRSGPLSAEEAALRHIEEAAKLRVLEEQAELAALVAFRAARNRRKAAEACYQKACEGVRASCGHHQQTLRRSSEQKPEKDCPRSAAQALAEAKLKPVPSQQPTEASRMKEVLARQARPFAAEVRANPEKRAVGALELREPRSGPVQLPAREVPALKAPSLAARSSSAPLSHNTRMAFAAAASGSGAAVPARASHPHEAGVIRVPRVAAQPPSRTAAVASADATPHAAPPRSAAAQDHARPALQSSGWLIKALDGHELKRPAAWRPESAPTSPSGKLRDARKALQELFTRKRPRCQ